MFDTLAHPNPDIARAGLEFYNLNRAGEIQLFSSTPIVNEFGEPTRRPISPQTACYFDEVGDFITIFNTNSYYYNDVSVEATAAWLDECINFRAAVLSRYDSFLKSNPDASFAAALVLNPEWIDESIVEAWYPTTAKIVAPYREKMPRLLTTTLLAFYDRCGIDFAQHEADPKKKEADWACWKENFGKIPLEQLEI